jgi:hypothetical protein
MYPLVISIPGYASHLTPTSDPHNFHKFLLLWKFQSCSLFLVLTPPIVLAPWFSSIPHRSNISTTPYVLLPCHYPLLKSACSRGRESCLHICFDMFLKYPFSLSVASVGILCKTDQRHWGLEWVTKGWVALDPGSKDWEGRSPRQRMAGPGTPGVCSVPALGACALRLTMAGSAGWWRGGFFIPGRGDWTFISGIWDRRTGRFF